MAKIFKTTIKSSLLSPPVFFAAMIAFCAGFYETLNIFANQDSQNYEYVRLIENNTQFIVAFMIAMLPSFVTTKEFSNGTIRNKLISGTTKKGFFIAHLLVNSIITLIITLLYFLPMLIFFTGYFKMFKPYMVIFAIGLVFLGYMFITVIATVISTMFDKIIISLIVSLLLLFGFIFCESLLRSDLQQEKYYEEPIYNKYGEIVEERIEPNPFYVESKAARKAMWTARLITPMIPIEYGTEVINGQLTSYEMYKQAREEAKNVSDQHPSIYENNVLLFYSPIVTCGMITAVSVLGVFLFKRRNIK